MMLVVDSKPQKDAQVDFKAVECVLFDLDGTLIDTVDLIYQSFDYAVKTVLGLTLSKEKLLENMGRPLLVQMQKFSQSRADELVQAYNHHNLSKHDQYISSYPGTKKQLEWLKETGNFKIGVVTSKKRNLSLRGLEITGLLKYVDVVVAMEDTLHHKPDAEPVLSALEKLVCRPAATLFVGDSPFDIAAGKSAGTATAAAMWGPFDHATLRAMHPDAELYKPAELRLLLA